MTAVDSPMVYVTQPLHPDALQFLAQHAQVRTAFGPGATAVDDVVRQVEGFVVRHLGLSGDVIRRASALRAIARAGAGYENVDVAAARARGIPVYLSASANSRSVAEHVFALALAVLRDIVRWDRLTRESPPDLRERRERDLGHDLSGKRLGIIGLGRIGAEVAAIGKHGFGMTVSAYHPRRTDEEIRAVGAEPVPTLKELLAGSDVVSIQLPLTPDTKGMIGAAELSAMRPGAILINVGRGGIVDEYAVASAISEGRLGGAGFDVFEGMFPPKDHPLLHVDGVVVTPHRAGRTDEAQRAMGLRAVQALLDALAGREPRGVVEVTGVGTSS